jgi:GNAT superfamily N-acetyltransferase
MSTMEIEIHATPPADRDLEAARRVYEAAFRPAPYHEDAAAGTEFIERVRRYAATRDGFRLYLARGNDRVVGLVLAVVARPGEWWREQVATAVGPAGAARWLGDACVEVVHVAVCPDEQSRGVGTDLMTTMQEEAVAERAILGVHPEAGPAQRLYQRLGWQLISTTFALGDRSPSWLLGRRLP